MKGFQFLATLLLAAQVHAAQPAAPPLLVYAAASLTNVLQEMGAAYQYETGQPVKFSFASSATLARQIESGARADVFISADSDWMNYLQQRQLIKVNSRYDLLGNRLVLIAPADSNLQLTIAPNFALARALGNGRLSVGDPDSVPAGKYAREALSSLGVWNEVTNKLVRGDSVRTALVFVERGEAPLGIVYETDALPDKRVRIVDYFPVDSHAPIVYPIALTVSANKDADKFITYLCGKNGTAIFSKHSFSVLK
ncbi:MAG: molybdate ABC transporter substrate-binding protein [Steroidobacteraceae bacterium]